MGAATMNPPGSFDSARLRNIMKPREKAAFKADPNVTSFSWERTRTSRHPAPPVERSVDGSRLSEVDDDGGAGERTGTTLGGNSVLSSRVGLRDVRASPEEHAEAYELADTTLNFSNDRLMSIAKLSSVRSATDGTSLRDDELDSGAGDSHGNLNLDMKRLASIASGKSVVRPARTPVDCSLPAQRGEAPAAELGAAVDGSLLWNSGGGRARAGQHQAVRDAVEAARRRTLTPAESVVGVRGIAADTVGQSVASLRSKLARLGGDGSAAARPGGGLGFDVAPHLDSLAAMSSAHVAQKRQDIAHAQNTLDKASEEIRHCQEQEAAEFDGKVRGGESPSLFFWGEICSAVSVCVYRWVY